MTHYDLVSWDELVPCDAIMTSYPRILGRHYDHYHILGRHYDIIP